VFWLTLIIGLAGTAVTLVLAARRVLFLYRLARSGQPDPERVLQVKRDPKGDVEGQVTEVFGQRKLLKWTVAGMAHFVVMWAFFLLATVYLEAAVVLLFGLDAYIPFLQSWGPIGFVQDTIALLALVGLITFAVIRIRNSPKRLGRQSRFKGSHLGAGPWIILVMIFNVIWTMFLFRGAGAAAGHLPYGSAAYASHATGKLMDGLSEHTLEIIESIGLLLHIGVALVFLLIVVNSKHLHIFLAPLNVMFKRRPDGLGAVQPMMSNGKPLDFEEADPDTDTFGRGKIEDFTWKGFLDFATCTECGRCQSQCPAWNTGKPLSPKMVILDLRDHAFAKAPYLLASESERDAFTPEDLARMEVDKPLVAEDGVIHPDVLWSCTNCGACVEQCPVDIEHIDHILDMRRFQVMIESSFPSEAGVMLKNLENKGNPWGMSEMKRLEWIEELDFEVEVVDEKMPADAEYLFWVGCAGALEDRAKKTTKAVAELLHIAGVKFAVLGPMEACSGDPARRLGMEFVYQMLAQQNVETLNEAGVKKIVATCPHCFNTLANEYPQLGGVFEVVHHTQLLAHLVETGKLTPVTPIEEKITYHDPCFLGRHNKVYKQPRDIMATVPGVQTQEMHRHKDRGFCCGAGGARMWMEERIGKRINTERVDEALGTDPDTVSTACPFCLVMLGDAINEKKNSGEAKESLEVVDVSQLLIKSVKGQPVEAS
jgi:Fe-S oxidoreductase